MSERTKFWVWAVTIAFSLISLGVNLYVMGWQRGMEACR